MEQSRLNQVETADNAEDNPALSNVIERNIRTIIGLRLTAAHERGLQDRIADGITSFSGRMVFVYVHIFWFALWIAVEHRPVRSAAFRSISLRTPDDDRVTGSDFPVHLRAHQSKPV